MKNRIFKRKSSEEKKRYLEAVLKTSSGGALDAEMIERIIRNLSIHKQYTISVFSSKKAYYDAISRAIPGNALTSISFYRCKNSPRVAIFTPHIPLTGFMKIRAIYICAPTRKRKR